MDLTSIPQWGWWTAVALGALLLALAGFLLVRSAYRRLSRRHLIKVIGRREGVLASRSTLEAVMRHIADEDEERLDRFAMNPEDEDRRALSEVAQRMDIVTEELDTMPLPRSLWPAAAALADAAYVIGQEAGRLGESDDPYEVRAELEQIDVSRVALAFTVADERVKEASERFDLDEAAVYGGGLYI